MSLLSDYRVRIKTLLAADDIQKALELEGIPTISARAIGVSRAIIAQRSIRKAANVAAPYKQPNAPQQGAEDCKEH